MADEAGEVNTAVEDGEAEQQLHEPEVSEAAPDLESGGSEEPERPEKASPAAAESSWSAPILSLARKATETISSGVSYAAAPRNPSAASARTERESENDLNNTSKKLPGRLTLQLTFALKLTFIKHADIKLISLPLVNCWSAVRTHDFRSNTSISGVNERGQDNAVSSLTTSSVYPAI